MLALKRGHDFERSPHGFCHGWQNGSPGTLKSGSRVGVGSVLVFSRSGAGETQLFPIGIMDSANSGFRPFIFFEPLVFTFFQGAAAAAAGRGSPPPPRRGEAMDVERAVLWRAVVAVAVDVVGSSKVRRISTKRTTKGRGLRCAGFPSPLRPGGPGGAITL